MIYEYMKEEICIELMTFHSKKSPFQERIAVSFHVYPKRHQSCIET